MSAVLLNMNGALRAGSDLIMSRTPGDARGVCVIGAWLELQVSGNLSTRSKLQPVLLLYECALIFSVFLLKVSMSSPVWPWGQFTHRSMIYTLLWTNNGHAGSNQICSLTNSKIQFYLVLHLISVHCLTFWNTAIIWYGKYLTWNADT